MINITINGSQGKMGQAVQEYLQQSSKYQLQHKVDIGTCLDEVLQQESTDVVIDFTQPEIRMQTVETALKNNAHAVVGTTGFTPDNLEQIKQWTKEYNKSCFIAPNFIIGNVLMQQFAAKAALYYDNCEIIEYHHQHKLDYPSGTAVKTAELIAKENKIFNNNTNDKVANIEGARGADFNGIKIHAVRMAGFIASQEVILGDEGQYLTIRHDSIDRQCYMMGVFMAVDYVMNNPANLTYGLEHIL